MYRIPIYKLKIIQFQFNFILSVNRNKSFESSLKLMWITDFLKMKHLILKYVWYFIRLQRHFTQ